MILGICYNSKRDSKTKGNLIENYSAGSLFALSHAELLQNNLETSAIPELETTRNT